MEGEQIGFLERTLVLMERYGMWKIMQAILVLASFLYIIYNVSSLPEIISSAFVRQTEIRQEEHDAAVETRRQIKPDIDRILKDALSNTNADRVFVIEMHNGTNNVAGLPFIYGEMTYEEVRTGVVHIDEDYTSVNLSRFKFAQFLEEKHMWYGNINDLEKIDSKMASRLRSNDVTYLAIITLHGVSNQLGYYGFTYCEGRKPCEITEVVENLTISAQKLSILLDAKN